MARMFFIPSLEPREKARVKSSRRGSSNMHDLMISVSPHEEMDSSINQSTPPDTPLAAYRLLSSTASVHVSPICLSGRAFGEKLDGRSGCSKETAFRVLDHYYQKGGNFIQTANNYQFGQSERWIGEWMNSRGVRNQIVLATKYSSNFRTGHDPSEIQVNCVGNGLKSLRDSLENSLHRLQTRYVDILYVNCWDRKTSIEELMQGLNRMVAEGKVFYLGISGTPAFIVSRANEYARNHGLRPFSVYQSFYNENNSSMEREILSMADYEKMGVSAWAVITEGVNSKGTVYSKPLYPPPVKRVLSRIAKSLGGSRDSKGFRKTVPQQSILLAYMLARYPSFLFPTVSCTDIETLDIAVQALELRLDPTDVEDISIAITSGPHTPNTDVAIAI